MEFSGVIAQELREIIPEAVTQEEGDGYYSVDSERMWYAGIIAIQELHAQVQSNKEMFMVMQEGLQAQVEENSRNIASLAEEVEELKSENKMLKSYLCAKDPAAPFCQ